MAAERFETDKLRIAVLAGVLVLLLAAAIYVGSRGVGPEQMDAQAGVQIDSCTTIDEPGRYVLTADITNTTASTCIRITTSDVVFDGNGHTIDGRGTFGTAGVLVGSFGNPTANVTVQDATVTDWDDGIRYINVDSGTVANTTTAHNRIGLTLLNSSRNMVTNNTATANAVYGISFQGASHNNTITNNTATSNSLFGIHLVAGATNNTLVGNTASDNEHGIVLIGADSNTVRNNTAMSNRIAGIWLSEADNNRLVNNTISNRFYGIYLGDRSSRNTLASNTATRNAVGLRLLHSSGNVITANRVTGNSVQGILLLASGDTVITENHLANNSAAIVLARSDNVTRTNNTING
jgi:parallel beta-helix repeat protein